MTDVISSTRWWGIRVKAMRTALSLTQRELAVKTGLDGVTQTTISKIEAGKQEPSLLLAIELSRVLGTPIETLFTRPLVTDEQVAA